MFSTDFGGHCSRPAPMESSSPACWAPRSEARAARGELPLLSPGAPGTLGKPSFHPLAPNTPKRGIRGTGVFWGVGWGCFEMGLEGSSPVVPPPGSRDAALLVPAWKAQLFPGKLRPPRACIIPREIPAWVWGVAAPMQPGVAPSARAQAARASLGCSIHGWTGGQTDRQPRSSCPRGAGLCRNPSKSQRGAARNV